MKIRYLSSFFRIFSPTSRLFYHGGTDYLTSTATLCYLVFQSVKLVGRQIPFTFLRNLEGFPRDTHTFSSQQSDKSMNTEDLNPNPKKRMRKSPDQLGEIEPVQNLDLLFNEQAKSVKRPKISKKTKSASSGASTDRPASERPNYFVAVQISNPEIHENVKEVQQQILSKDSSFEDCMTSVSTLHITLMVVNIKDKDTHKRAKKALANVHQEYNEVMCKNPLTLEFSGIGEFNHRVIYAKLKENESYTRLHTLADSVQKHFAKFEIFSTDKRGFNPHLTIAKIDFKDRKQRALKKIPLKLYEEFMNNDFGRENICGIQLLKMSGPKDSTGYYTGKKLFFSYPTAIPFKTSIIRKQIIANTSENKKKVREKIAEATKNSLKKAFSEKKIHDK